MIYTALFMDGPRKGEYLALPARLETIQMLVAPPDGGSCYFLWSEIEGPKTTTLLYHWHKVPQTQHLTPPHYTYTPTDPA